MGKIGTEQGTDIATTIQANDRVPFINSKIVTTLTHPQNLQDVQSFHFYWLVSLVSFVKKPCSCRRFLEYGQLLLTF